MKSIGKLTLLASLALAAAGCVTAPPIVSAAGACSELLPASWELGVEGAAVPAEASPKPVEPQAVVAWTLDQLKAWTSFGVEESARREIANGRTTDTIGIIRRCEARDRKAVDRARPKFLGLF